MRFVSVLFALALLVFSGCGNSPEEGIDSVDWMVMGTSASLKGIGLDPAWFGQVNHVFARIEELLSAFDEKSELSRLKQLSDEEILAKCDSSVRFCYEQAFKLRDLTGSRFNPRWRGAGTMDLGAIAKGFAVDFAAAEIETSVRKRNTRALIDLGGNLKAIGGDWRVGVFGTEDALVLKDGEACATSGEYFRGAHIKDGRDGSDLANRVFSVTVVHPSSATLADGLSTVMFILGRSEGERFLAAHFPEARAIWSEKSK